MSVQHTRGRPSRLLGVLSLLVILGLVSLGCGSNDSNDRSATDSGGSSSPTTAGSTSDGSATTAPSGGSGSSTALEIARGAIPDLTWSSTRPDAIESPDFAALDSEAFATSGSDGYTLTAELYVFDTPADAKAAYDTMGELADDRMSDPFDTKPTPQTRMQCNVVVAQFTGIYDRDDESSAHNAVEKWLDEMITDAQKAISPMYPSC